jgi:hypothetical protein
MPPLFLLNAEYQNSEKIARDRLKTAVCALTKKGLD